MARSVGAALGFSAGKNNLAAMNFSKVGKRTSGKQSIAGDTDFSAEASTRSRSRESE